MYKISVFLNFVNCNNSKKIYFADILTYVMGKPPKRKALDDGELDLPQKRLSSKISKVAKTTQLNNSYILLPLFSFCLWGQKGLVSLSSIILASNSNATIFLYAGTLSLVCNKGSLWKIIFKEFEKLIFFIVFFLLQ